MMNEKRVGKVNMINAVKVAALVVGTLFLLAAVGEIAARMLFRKNVDALRFSQSDMYYYTDQQGVRHHIPDKTGYERLWDDSGKVEVRINSLGFRGKDIRADKAEKVTRIFFLGDSITFGSRLPENDIFVAKLGRRFQPDAGRTYEVVNGGAVDAGLREEHETLKRSIGIQPDLVVLCWYLNDGRPPLGFPEEVVFNNKIIQYINHQAWLRKSYLAGFIYDKVRASS